jgi:predicted dehydrogenase
VILNVVLVGPGWAGVERHLPSIQRHPRARLLGVVAANEEAARTAAAAAGAERWGTSLAEPWLDAADAVTIAAPPYEHADLVEEALARGLHVLCEKPFVLPPARAWPLVEEAERRGLVLAVVHNFQFSHAGRRLFRLLEAGELGAVEAVYGFQLSNPERRLPGWADSLPGGLFTDEAAHLLYLTRRVLGGRLDVRSVDARLRDRHVRDITMSFEHETVWASISMSFEASLSEWQFVVVGRRAVAAFDVFRDVLVVVPNDHGHLGRDVLRTSGSLVARHLAGVATSGGRLVAKRLFYGNDELFDRFVEAVEGRPEALAWSTGADGAAVVEAMGEVLGRAGVDLTTR